MTLDDSDIISIKGHADIGYKLRNSKFGPLGSFVLIVEPKQRFNGEEKPLQCLRIIIYSRTNSHKMSRNESVNEIFFKFEEVNELPECLPVIKVIKSHKTSKVDIKVIKVINFMKFYAKFRFFFVNFLCTYGDATAILSKDKKHIIASNKLQNSLNEVKH